MTEGAEPEPARVILDALVEIDARLDRALFVGFAAAREDPIEEAMEGEMDEERASAGCSTAAKRLTVDFSEVLRPARSLLQDRGTTVPSNELRRLSPDWSSRAHSRR